MDFLETWLENSDIPVVTAFILGLLTAVSPCPLATNITAIGFISKNIENRHRIFWQGMLYTFGRMVAYTLLGGLLIAMLRRGMDTFGLQESVSRLGELLVAPVLVIAGILMLCGDSLLPAGLEWNAPERAARLSGTWGSWLLGVLFALAFCPTSGLLYFGMLIPLSASATGGYALPAVYALATGLPVVAVAWVIAYSVANIAGFYHRLQLFQRWFSRLVACLFMLVGLYYAVIFYF